LPERAFRARAFSILPGDAMLRICPSQSVTHPSSAVIMKSSLLVRRSCLVSCLGLGLALAGCQSTPPASGGGASAPGSPTASPAEPLRFIDLQSFDEALSRALSEGRPTVAVAFYDRVTPNALPARLQSWMAAVETHGGKIQVVPDPDALATRNPVLIIGALTTLWSAFKVGSEMAYRALFRKVQGYDAQIRLRNNAAGESLIDRIVFVRRPG
jgi:hypothetical protein